MKKAAVVFSAAAVWVITGSLRYRHRLKRVEVGWGSGIGRSD